MGKTIKEDAILASMPRIRISAAKNHNMQSTIAGATKRNFFDSNGKQIISGLTPGNLSKISAVEKDSRVNSAAPENPNLGLARQNYSNDGSEMQESHEKRERRTFARGISLAAGDKAQQV